MKTFSIILLSTLYSICLQAADIQGVIKDSSNTPIVGVNITIRTLEGAQVMERTQSLSDGAFILKGVNPGNYTLVCTHMGLYRLHCRSTSKQGSIFILRHTNNVSSECATERSHG